MALTDLYRQLFGKDHIKDGDVISMAEHGRTGGVSTGQGFKFSRSVDELMKVDEASATVTYIGTADFGTAADEAGWQLKRITVSGTVTTIEYADSANYSQVWDSRAAATYS